MRARILGIGSAVPSEVLTNEDLEKRVDTSDEWITTRTGIRERHLIEPDRDNSDLVVEACRGALDAAGIGPESVDALIVATATPDTVFPATAAWAQPKLGLGRIPVFDVSAACSGFLYATVLGNAMIASGTARKVLVCGSEVLSRSVNWQDRSTCVLFGDGAGAALMGPSDDPDRGLMAWTWGADGSLAELLWQPAGGTRFQASHETVEKRLHAIHMRGNEVFKYAVKAMERAVAEVLDRAGLTAADVDLFVPHQANIRIIRATAERAGIPEERVYLTIQRYGNTSAASVPMALADAVREGRIRPGDVVVTAAFGAGFTWAATAFRW